MSPEQLAALLTALGIGSILPETVRAIWKWASGRIGRERNAVAFERKRADRAERGKREAMEYAAVLRLRLLERGVAQTDIPAWPSELTKEEPS